MNSYPGMPAPDVDDVAGVAVGVVAVGVGVAVGVDCDAEDGYMQDPLPMESYNYEIVSYHLKIKHSKVSEDNDNKQARK